MPLYSCNDGYCGADDCSRCFPGNEHEQGWNQAKDEEMERRADQMRDEAADDRD